MLLQSASYRSVHEKVETPSVLMNVFELERPDVVIHLALKQALDTHLKIHVRILRVISTGLLSF